VIVLVIVMTAAQIGLLQNRIVAKMISTKHPDQAASRRVIPTSGVKKPSSATHSPTRSSKQGILQQPEIAD